MKNKDMSEIDLKEEYPASSKEEFKKVCKDICQQMDTHEYMEVSHGGVFSFFLKGDGQIVGSSGFRNIYNIHHIDDIDLANAEHFPLVSRLKAHAVNEETLKANPGSGNILSHSCFNATLGEHHYVVIQKMKNKDMSFDEFFDLVKGPRRNGEFFDYLNDAPKFVSVLTKDVFVDVLLEKDGKFEWSKHAAGKIGDSVMTSENSRCLYVEIDGKLGAFSLLPDEINATQKAIPFVPIEPSALAWAGVDQIKDKRQTKVDTTLSSHTNQKPSLS